MSNALAIATVTAAFSQIIRTAALSVQPVLSHGVEVLSERPSPTDSDDPSPQVRLFLYQVTPNAALRNNDLPIRTGKGNLIRRSIAALDLHYLLSFYGDDTDFEPQIMLGAVIRDIHAKPVLPRQLIRDVIGSGRPLGNSNLADAIEQIKFTPLPLSLEELSKLWSVFFQAPYVLSVAYQATVVLIDGEETPSPALPVLTRGLDDRGVNISVGPFPAIESIHIGAPEDVGQDARLPSYPSAQVGAMLTITGSNLGGGAVSVRFDHIKLGLTHSVVVQPAGRTGTGLTIRINDDASWAAGFYTVTVLVENAGQTRTSNQLPLPFSPKISTIAWVSAVTLSITLDPVMRSTQRASLLVENREVEAEVPGADTGTLRFNLAPAARLAGAIVRLRIDGIDSLPFRREARLAPLPPTLVFDDAQRVPVP